MSHSSFRSSLAAIRSERTRQAPALVSGGRFDTRAIMVEAVRFARTLLRSTGSWQARMGIALRIVWQRAKAAMVQACAAEPFPIREPAPVRASRPQARPAVTSRAFTWGSRSHTHGW